LLFSAYANYELKNYWDIKQRLVPHFQFFQGQHLRLFILLTIIGINQQIGKIQLKGNHN